MPRALLAPGLAAALAVAGALSPAAAVPGEPPVPAPRPALQPAAAADLRAVAEMRTGVTVPRLEEGESPGTWTLALGRTSCGLPEAAHGRVARLEAALREKAAEDLEALIPFADADGSGTVTTEEAGVLRRLVEFGYLADLLVRERALSLPGIALAAGIGSEEAASRIERYNALALRLNGATERSMPVLVLVERP